MSEYDRLVDILTDLVCKFCPVCAKRLKEVTAQATITNSGAQNGTVSWRMKTCPDGHGSFGVDHRWDPHDGNPDALFEPAPDLFKICGHCGESMKGYASWGNEWLCHPDEGMDCYRLVTVYNHPRDAKGDCSRCKNPTFFDQLREVQAIVDEANKKD